MEYSSSALGMGCSSARLRRGGGGRLRRRRRGRRGAAAEVRAGDGRAGTERRGDRVAVVRLARRTVVDADRLEQRLQVGHAPIAFFDELVVVEVEIRLL